METSARAPWGDPSHSDPVVSRFQKLFSALTFDEKLVFAGKKEQGIKSSSVPGSNCTS